MYFRSSIYVSMSMRQLLFQKLLLLSHPFFATSIQISIHPSPSSRIYDWSIQLMGLIEYHPEQIPRNSFGFVWWIIIFCCTLKRNGAWFCLFLSLDLCFSYEAVSSLLQMDIPRTSLFDLLQFGWDCDCFWKDHSFFEESSFLRNPSINLLFMHTSWGEPY